MKLIGFFTLMLWTLASQAYGNVEIQKMDFNQKSNMGTITVHFNGNLKDYPELKVIGKSIQVNIPNSKVKKNLERAVSFSSSLKDTQIRVYQTTPKTTRIKALLPFDISKRKNQVALTIKDNRVELAFPKVKVNLKKAPKFGTIVKKKKAKVKKEFLDESYLNSLLTIKDSKKKKKPVDTTAKKEVIIKPMNITAKDKVSSKQAAPSFVGKEGSFSLLEYGGKFVAFLGFVLLLFYGVITLMKKGFIKKGKLGFLNNADQISVINQTYIAPKKSLMLVRAHNQVFLVSNTDTGIHPISEIRDAAGLFKEGEKALSGMNFDTNLDEANKDEKIETKVKLKEDISESNKESSLSSYMNVKEKVKFSDQIKKKVKNLKPLH